MGIFVSFIVSMLVAVVSMIYILCTPNEKKPISETRVKLEKAFGNRK